MAQAQSKVDGILRKHNQLKRDNEKNDIALGQMVQTDLVNFVLWLRKKKLNTFSNWLELNAIVKKELGVNNDIRALS